MTFSSVNPFKLLSLFILASLALLFTAKAYSNDLPNFIDLVKKNEPAVVNISSIQKARQSSYRGRHFDDEVPDILRHFFGENFQYPAQDQTSLGSGFIISDDGYILTNYHVIQGADEVIVRLQDRRELPAQIIGSDSKTDLALLKIKAKDLPTVSLGESSSLEVGEWVLAIGSPFGFEASATKGIVSYLGRSLSAGDYVPYIQTDVPINSGNSGGPLFNLEGKVVGINSRIYTNTGGFMGLSFAIPIDTAQHVVEQLKEYGRVRRGWLGVSIRDIDALEAEQLGLDKPMGAYVAGVVKNSPADDAGLQAGDIILSFDGKDIDMSANLPVYAGQTQINKKVKLHVWRNGELEKLNLRVGMLPDEEALSKKRLSTGLSDSLGLKVGSITREQQRKWGVSVGVSVEEVSEDPGLSAGILVGDIITQVNNRAVEDLSSYQQVLNTLPSNKWIPVLIYRRGQPINLPLKLGH